MFMQLNSKRISFSKKEDTKHKGKIIFALLIFSNFVEYINSCFHHIISNPFLFLKWSVSPLKRVLQHPIMDFKA